MFLEKYLLSIPGHEKVPEDRACSYLATTVGILDYVFYYIVKCNKIVCIFLQLYQFYFTMLATKFVYVAIKYVPILF